MHPGISLRTVSEQRAVARVGISGWTYQPWRGVFYPRGLVQREELAYAADRLDSIEINGTFYALQRPSSYLRWRDETPDDFVFSVKGGRYITHILRLKDATQAVAGFFASGVLALQEKLGPILWQLPQTLRFDPESLESFLASLPRSVDDARRLVAEHSQLKDDRTWTDTTVDRPIRHALEVRHESFLDPTFTEILRRHNVAVVVADTAGRWPRIREVTADFVYVRLHGDTELYTSGYDDNALDDWAQTVRGWLTGESCPDGRGRDVFAYFDNDTKVRAPFDAMHLRERLAAI
ncbi:MAG: hypothetical protein JWP70_1626 [Leifsonia sp.]|nr:hypothetical protein [Leifsonia sp.]